jgi:CheY-like chemotaxis protein
VYVCSNATTYLFVLPVQKKWVYNYFISTTTLVSLQYSICTMKNKLVILIVDDNMKFVERMIAMLDELDNVEYINVANNYDEARQSLASEKHDLVLLDINLPGKNGIELLRKIKFEEATCNVIMISNHHDEYYREQCRELGASYFLDKSNDFGMVPLIVGKMNKN